jgi:20S proteasome subunit beta 2
MVMSPNGNTMHVPYAAMGSGSLAALSVLETNYRDGLDEQQAIDLAADAIQAGIFHDLGSGSNVNVFSVTKGETKKLYKYREFNKKVYKDEELFKFKGITPVLSRYEVNWSDIKIEKIPIKIDDNKMMIELA